MTKTELIKAIAKSGAASTLQEAGTALDAIFEALKDCLVAGEPINFQNFGTFKIEERSARKGRNPRTGEEIDIPAQKTVKFSPAKSLKEAIADS